MLSTQLTYAVAILMLSIGLLTPRSMLSITSSDVTVFSCVTAVTFAGFCTHNSPAKVIENLYKKREAKTATANDDLMIKIYESNKNIVRAAVYTYNAIVSAAAGIAVAAAMECV